MNSVFFSYFLFVFFSGVTPYVRRSTDFACLISILDIQQIATMIITEMVLKIKTIVVGYRDICLPSNPSLSTRWKFPVLDKWLEDEVMKNKKANDRVKCS